MITVLNAIDPNTPVGKLLLAAAATTDISDKEFEIMLLRFEIPVDEKEVGLLDLFKILEVVSINRPILYKNFENWVLENKVTE